MFAMDIRREKPMRAVLLSSLVVALAKWGEEGLYRIAAASDPAVETAAKQFDRATAILNAARPN
jgi:hypothetical protein